MMRIRVTRTMRWAPDGINMVLLADGTTIELPDGIAASWIEAGLAERVEDDPPAREHADDGERSGGDEKDEAPGVVEMATVTKKIIQPARGRPRRFRP